MAKIQEPDASVLNRLAAKSAGKTATEGHSEVAFKDHEEFLATLDDILSEDNKTSWDPNEPTLD
jgi:hypothetical protein